MMFSIILYTGNVPEKYFIFVDDCHISHFKDFTMCVMLPSGFFLLQFCFSQDCLKAAFYTQAACSILK